MKIPGFDDDELESQKNKKEDSDDSESYEQEEFHDDDDDISESLEEMLNEAAAQFNEDDEDSNEMTEEEKKEKLTELIIQEFPTSELDKFGAISGSIIGDKTQPIVLLSEKDFEFHHLYIGHACLRFPSRAVPYLIEALTNLYEMNGSSHFDIKKDPKNYKKFQDYNDNIFDSKLVTYHSLELGIKEFIDFNKKEYEEFSKKYDIDSSVFGSNAEIKQEVIEKVIESFGNLSTEEKIEFIKKAKAIKEKLNKKFFESEKAEDLLFNDLEKEAFKEARKKDLAESMTEFEKLVRGVVNADTTKEESIEDIYKRVSIILERDGEMAAKEELYRIPEEIRDQVLEKIVENIEKNRK